MVGIAGNNSNDVSDERVGDHEIARGVGGDSAWSCNTDPHTASPLKPRSRIILAMMMMPLGGLMLMLMLMLGTSVT